MAFYYAFRIIDTSTSRARAPLSFKSFLRFGERRGEFKKTRSRAHEKGAKRNLISVYITCSGRNKPRPSQTPELQSINKRTRNIKCIVDYLVLSCYLKVFLARLSLCLVFYLQALNKA